MAFKKSLIFATMALCAVSSMGVQYQVGESDGWDIMGGDDYYQGWASTKNFHAGDILVFNYDSESHDVEQVTNQDFESCIPTSPLAIYNNGSDTVTLDKEGHYYFICGVPGHCLAGQKLHVSVTAPPSLNPSPAPTPSPSPSSTHSPTSSPSPSYVAVTAPPSPNPSPAPTPSPSPSHSHVAVTAPTHSNSDIPSSSEVLVMSGFFWGLVVTSLVVFV